MKEPVGLMRTPVAIWSGVVITGTGVYIISYV